MSIRHPGYYTSWLHVVTDMTTTQDVNLYDWIGDWTQANYGHRWTNTSKKLNAIITIPAGHTISSTNHTIPAILIDNQFRYFDRITLKIAGTVIGGYRDFCFAFINQGFTLPTQSITSGITTAKDASTVNTYIAGGGGGGGTGNEKGNGGGGGGGGGGGFIAGTFYGKPGTTVSMTLGTAGSRGLTRNEFTVQSGGAGGDSVVQFTDQTNTSYTWTARGGGGGGGGGSNNDCDGCVGFGGGSGGSGGSTTVQGPYAVFQKTGDSGGNGSAGSSDTSSGTGGAGGNSGAFGFAIPWDGPGGAGGPVGGDGGFGNHRGGGGGGGGFKDRSGVQCHNSGGPGAGGEVDLTYHREYLAGTGILIKNNFPGYIEINNQGGVVGGHATAITGTVDAYTPTPIAVVNIPVLPPSPC